jgi:hypothetical protein
VKNRKSSRAFVFFALPFLISINAVIAEETAPFNVSKSKVEEASLEKCATYLVQFAQCQINRDKNFGKSKQYDRFIHMALLLAPKNKQAVLANGRLRKGKEAKKSATEISISEFSDTIMIFNKSMNKKKTDDAAKMGGYLLSLAASVDKDNEDVEYDLEIYEGLHGAPLWGAKGRSLPKIENKIKSSGRGDTKVRQSRINALVVSKVNGTSVGKTSKVLATFFPKKKKNNLISVEFVRRLGKGGSMHVSLHEAVRYWRTLDIATLTSGDIEMSFEDKYTLKDGGSAGTAYVILLRALDEGFKIDTKFAVTGDISVEGKILQIGGVFAKVRGAMTDGCNYVGVPMSNESELTDGILLNGLETLGKIEIFSFDSIEDILKLAKEKKDDKYKKMTALFKKIPDFIEKKDWEKDTAELSILLAQILAIDANHLSAKILLKHIEGKMPKSLTTSASIEEIDKHLRQYLMVIAPEEQISVYHIQQETKSTNIRKYADALRKIKPVIHPDILKFHEKARLISSSVRLFISAKTTVTGYGPKIKAHKAALEKREREWKSGKQSKAKLRGYNGAIKRYNSTIAGYNKAVEKKDKYWKQANERFKDYVVEIRNIVADPKVLERLIRGK